MKIKTKKFEKGNLVSSLVICFIGLILMFFPETTVNAVSYIIGSILIVFGVIKIVLYYTKKDKNSINVGTGVILTLLGLVVYVYGSNIIEISRILIGIFLVYNGAIKLILSFQLTKLSNNLSKISMFFAGILMLFGIFILFYSNTILFTIGLLLVVYSVLNIIQNIVYTKGISKVSKTDDNIVIIDEE